MLVAQLGSSPWGTWLRFAMFVLVAIAFGVVAVILRDGIATALCLVAVIAAARVGMVLWRRARWRDAGAEVVVARGGAVAAAGRMFVSLGHHTTGAWLQRGIVLIGPWQAAFIPVGARSHLAVELILGLFIARFRFVDVELYVSISAVDLDGAVYAAVERHGGFLLDRTWTYAPTQRWLTAPGANTIVWIERAPPPHLTARWAETQRSPEAMRARRDKAVQVLLALTTVCVLAGVLAWRWADEVDYLVAGLGYASLFAITLVAVVVLINREIRRAAGSPAGSPPRWPGV